MPHIAKILVPIDFSDRSLIAARHARALAKHFHSEVTVLHVNDFHIFYPPAGPMGYGATGWDATLSEYTIGRQRQLDAFGAEELDGITVNRQMLAGDAAKEIVEYAQKEKMDLILMPTRGYGPLRRFLLGSVTAKVLHDVECPVWTGAHLEDTEEPDPSILEHVICAVDFGSQSGKALFWAVEFAASFQARLTVAHSIPIPLPSPADLYATDWYEEAKRGVQERLESIVKGLPIKTNLLILDGGAPEALSAAAGEQGAGLMVIGRRNAPGVLGRLGSDAYGIISHSPCPVVSV